MKLSHVLLTAISVASSTTAQDGLCPKMPIDGLFILASSNYVFQIDCGVAYEGRVIAVNPAGSIGPWACAE